MTETHHVTIDTDKLAQTIDRIEQQSSDPESAGQIAGIAKMLLAEFVDRDERARAAEAEAAAYRMLQVDLWKLIGRCDMAFELITEAKLLGPAKKTARQLRAEIKKAITP